MTLRLALLVDSPSRGTYANAVGRLAVGLAETGRADTTLVWYRDHPPAQWLPEQIRLRPLGTGRIRASVPALVRYLWSEQPDVLISRQMHANLISLAVLAIARLGGRWSGRLVLFHDHHAEMSQGRNWEPDNKWLVKFGYRFADGYLAVAPTVRDDIIRWCHLPPRSVSVVPTPVTAFEPSATPPHPWLGDGEGPVFVAVGHLMPRKRVDLILDAVAELRHRHPVRLIVLGEGVERRRLEAKIARLGLGASVDMPGWVPEPREYVSRATALVHASEEESFGQVLTEAMTVRCPVIAADAITGGPRFVTDGGRYGILVPHGDAGALTEAMRTMLDARVRERYAGLGYKRAQVFSPRAIASALLDFLEETFAFPKIDSSSVHEPTDPVHAK